MQPWSGGAASRARPGLLERFYAVGDEALHQGLADIAQPVIQLLNYMASYDVASNTCRPYLGQASLAVHEVASG